VVEVGSGAGVVTGTLTGAGGTMPGNSLPLTSVGTPRISPLGILMNAGFGLGRMPSAHAWSARFWDERRSCACATRAASW